ncbi:MAG: SBBP repeat-containing protein, partial [Caldilineales bacterium]|nr:SBBP repeat-containing protein [Caldilineales bacterium]
RWSYAGAQRVEITAGGALVVTAPAGRLQEAAPVAYQEAGGRRTPVTAAFVLDDAGRVGFRLGPYDRTRLLVIDPTLVYATFLGGSDGDPFREYINDIAVDAAGNMLVTGMTPATDFPTANPVQTDRPGFDAFVAKISADGQTLLYATYLGGASRDEGHGIAVDASGAAYVAGETGSADFPTLIPFQSDQGGADAFVVKLSPAGQLVYASYLGGLAGDGAGDIAVDGQGRAVVTGMTASTGFPTQNPLIGPQFAFNGASSDAFVTVLNADGQSLVFSTYLGGGNDENIEGRGSVALDGVGNIYVVGTTRSTNFPVVNARQGTFGGGTSDAFLARIRADGSALDYATYLGGSAEDRGHDIAADAVGNAYVTGKTWSANFPVANAWQATHGGGIGDAFAARFTPAGAASFVTYLGGNGGDSGNAITANAAGEAYVTGCTSSRDFPIVNPLQSFPSIIGCAAFVVRFSADGSALRYATLLGGGEGFGITWARGHAYVVGEAGPHFVSRRPLKPPAAATGRGEAFVAQIDDRDYLFLPLVSKD